MHKRISDQQFQQLATLLHQGRHTELEAAARKVAESHPGDGRGWQLLGVSFLARDRFGEAAPWLERAAHLMPKNPSIWDNLGLAHFKAGRYEQADDCFQRSTSLQPDRLSAWLNWSACAWKAGSAEAAQQHARRALALNPDLADAWLNLGNALVDLGRSDEAAQAYTAALARRPGWPEAELSYGMLLQRQRRLEEAESRFLRARAGAPLDWRVHANLGEIYSALGRAEQASASLTEAVRCNPTVHEAQSGLLFLRLYEENAGTASVVAEHRAYGEFLEASRRAHWPNHANGRDPARRLKIGFVSGDFRNHPVASFLEPVLGHMNRAESQVFLYSCSSGEDDATRRLRGLADVWLQVDRLDEAQLTARILADGIDILVDLAGHSSYNRLPVFARRPAPVQVSWLGYPCTTGLTAIDYRPVYRVACPPGQLEGQFSENLVYLPCAPAFAHPADAPEVGPSPASARGALTFASLHRPDKLSDSVVRTWARILAALPTARLLIGAIEGEDMKAVMLRRFAAQGVPEHRLMFRPSLPMAEYLRLHEEIDVLLDPFPFSGLTTTEHAVWMGVPVLSLAGDALVKRQGHLVMTALGLGDWVVADEQAYVDKAVSIAADLPGLAELRRGLRERKRVCPLLQPELEATCLEMAFRAMWKRWCAGMAPESFEVMP